MSDFVPLPKQWIAMTCPAREVFYAGAAGPGKAQPVDAMVYTPYGPKPMGEIKVGDQVCHPDGGVATVIAVHPQGPRDIYRLRCADGATTRVTDDHLWLVHFAGKRTKRGYRRRIQTTKMLRERLERQQENNRAYRPIIPLTAPVRFNRVSRNRYGAMRPIDPYILGLLLGDGSLARTTPILTAYDQEIREWVHDLYPDARDLTETTISFPGMYEDIRRFELAVKSGHKHIPDAYKYASVSERWALTQGLMDTDGTVDAKGYVTFTSISEQLALDVQWLVRSLGFKATITQKQPFYTNPDGQRVDGQIAYNVYISGDNERNLFRLERKRQRTRRHFNGGVSEWGRRIDSIEYDGRSQAQCITVDHPDGLYLTDDFIVTHNSELFINIGKHRARSFPGSRHVYFRRVSKDLDAHIPKARHYIPSFRGDPEAIASFGGDKTVKRFTFLENRSEFTFTHLQQESHVAGHEGAEYDTIFFDEAGRFTQRQINFLQSRLRSTVEETHKAGGPKLYLAGNPQGVSFHYLRQNYVRPDPSYVKEVLAYYPIDEAMAAWEEAKQGLQVDHLHKADIQEACKRWIKLVRERGIGWRRYDPETAATRKLVEPYDVWVAYPNEIMLEYGISESHPRCFIPAYLEDNPYLGPDYVAQLAQLLGDGLADRLLKGDWSVFEGQFFSEWAETRRDPETGKLVAWHVVPPITPKEWWPKMAAMDWGYSKEAMLVIGFYCYDPERDEWTRFDEIAVNQLTDAQVISRYKTVAGPHQIEMVACDPAMFGKRDFESGMSQGRYYQEHGVPLSPADNNRVQGWQVLRSMLAVNPRTGRPFLRITENCRYAIETLPGLVHDEKKPEDLETEGEDHAADEMRYFAVKALGRGEGAYRPVDEPVGVGVWDSLAPIEDPRARELPSFLMDGEDDPWRDLDIP